MTTASVAVLDDLLAKPPDGQPPAPALFSTALRTLVTALRTEAALSPGGVAEAHRSLAAGLRVQRLAVAWAARHPDRAGVERPIVVTGLHRTGTTYLQQLLAAQPGLWAPALWELMHPVPVDGEDRAALVDLVRTYVRDYDRAAPRLRGLHPLEATGPEECHRLLGATFCSGIYGMRYRTPGYDDWLAGADLREAYGFHRLLLQALLSRGDGAGRVVLKCPLHVRHLDALYATYPDALVVQLHRAPHEAIASAANLTATIRATRSDRIDLGEIGAQCLEHAELVAAQALAGQYREVLHVRYRDLVEQPAGVLARICERAGLPGPRPSGRPQPGGPPRPPLQRATLADFRLSRDEIDRRLAGYRAHFRV